MRTLPTEDLEGTVFKCHIASVISTEGSKSIELVSCWTSNKLLSRFEVTKYDFKDKKETLQTIDFEQAIEWYNN